MAARERPETASPTKVVKMKNTPPSKPVRSGPSLPPTKLAAGSSPTKPAAAPPLPRRAKPGVVAVPANHAAAEVRPAADPVSEPTTNPLVAGTKRASPPPPSRPSPMPVLRSATPSPAGAPRVSSAQVSPAALAARAVSGAVDPAVPVRVGGTTLPGGPEATAIVKPLPSPGTGASPVVAAPSEGRRRGGDLGKWLIGGAVAAGALAVAFLAGAFDRPSAPVVPAANASPSDEEPSPRKKQRATPDPELRSPSDPPRTVGNSGAPTPPTEAARAPSEPPPETAKAPSEPPLEAAKAPSEPPPETAKAPSEPPPETAKAPSEPPPETATPAIAVKPAARPPSKPAAVAKKPANVATKPPPRRKPPVAKPPAPKPPATPPKWDPDSLFLKQD